MPTYTHRSRLKAYKGQLCRIIYKKRPPGYVVVEVAILMNKETGEELIREVNRGTIKGLSVPIIIDSSEVVND